MGKHSFSVTLDNDTYIELIELTMHRRDSSRSAKGNAIAAAVHAAHSKLPQATKKALREQQLQVGVMEKINRVYNWMLKCEAQEGIK